MYNSYAILQTIKITCKAVDIDPSFSLELPEAI